MHWLLQSIINMKICGIDGRHDVGSIKTTPPFVGQLLLWLLPLFKLEGTQGVRPHVVLLLTLTLTLTFDLLTQNHITCRISLHQVWTLWDHSFFSYAPSINLRNAHTGLWRWPLTFQPQIHVTSRSFSIPSLKTLCSFVFQLCCGQTNRQTNGLENYTHATDKVGVGNK